MQIDQMEIFMKQIETRVYIFFLGSALLQNCFTCWARWNGDVMPTLDAALLSSSRAGADLGRESGLVLRSFGLS